MDHEAPNKQASFMETSKGMGKSVVGCGMSTCAGFRDFLMRGNVVDMAVGIVVGAAFTDLVKAFVSDWITPLIGAIFSGGNFNDLTFSINGSLFFYGHFINVLITFLCICLVVYFLVVMPMNALIKRVYPSYFQAKRPGGCPYCKTADIAYTASKCHACTSDLPALSAKTLEVLEAEDDGAEVVAPASNKPTV